MENTNDLFLPLHISDENRYMRCVEEKTQYFVSQFEQLYNINRLSKYHSKIRQAIESIHKQLNDIKGIFALLLRGDVANAQAKMSILLASHKDVLITTINKSTAFCGEPFIRTTEGLLDNLYLFRGRSVLPYQTFSRSEMLHIPLNQRGIVSSYRFSIPGVPCIYLSSNSYTVWSELSRPDLKCLCISSFCLSDYLLNQQIIDLTLPIYEYYEILTSEKLKIEEYEEECNYLIDCMAVLPLIIACSVVCDNSVKRSFIVEYAFPQLLMQFLADNLIGIAYRSNRIGGGRLPANNLAIPIRSFEEGQKYGKITEWISVSDALNIGYFSDFIVNNSSISAINKSAKGPSSKRMGQSFSLKLREAESTFNKQLSGFLFANSYDGLIQYKDSLFYKFDEYLLFLNELKKI